MAFVSKMRILRWEAAKPDEGRFPLREGIASTVTAAAPPGPPLSKLAQIMWEEGMPQAGGKTAKQEAVRLLQIAAEVEHALLVQYLYAAYSLNTNVEQSVAAQSQIIEVAKQGMAHLITVQNLLLSLGISADLNRENFSNDPQDYPFPVSLEPLSSDALAKYVTAESPTIDKVPAADRDDVIRIAKQADNAVSGTTSKVNHVGVIYAKIYWLFQANDAAEGPWTLDSDVIDCFVRTLGAGFHVKDSDFADPAIVSNFSATALEWGVGDTSMHVDSGLPRNNAQAAIAWITAQGEGPNAAAIPQSHFQTFLALYRSFKDFPPNAVLDIPINPVTISPAGAGPSTNLITNPVALLWAQIFNLRYQILLLDITTGLAIDRSKADALRTTVMKSWAVRNEMANFLSTIGPALTLKKRTAAGTTRPIFSGAPFELDEIPVSLCDQWKKQKDLVAKCAGKVAELKPLLDAGDTDKDFLDSIVTFDQGRQAVIDQKIAELCVQ